MAVDMFLDFSAGPSKGGLSPINVVGESVDKAFPKTIVVDDFSFSAENPTTIGSSTAGAGKAKLNKFTLSKSIDSASPSLFQSLVSGAHFPSVKFLVRKAGASGAYLTYTLNMVFVTSIESKLSSDGVPQEDIELMYGAVQISYQPAGTQTDKAIVASWNQINNSSNIVIP